MAPPACPEVDAKAEAETPACYSVAVITLVFSLIRVSPIPVTLCGGSLAVPVSAPFSGVIISQILKSVITNANLY